MQLIFDSRNESYKKPFGAVTGGTPVTFKVMSDADRVILQGFGDPIQMEKESNLFTATVAPSIDCGLIFYTFEAHDKMKMRIYGRGEGGEAQIDGTPYQLTVHNNRDNPDWFRGSVMYQIYVDRFYKSDSLEVKPRDNVLVHTSWNDQPLYVKNERGEIVSWDFFGGNLQGVIDQLDYIASLGVDIIYLNPIFESISNHKYDTGDYKQIDRMYGTTDTLKRLVSAAAARGIKIMLDGVFSHTGDDSIYFNKYKTYGDSGAYNDPESPYFEWYCFEQYPDKYDCWWGVTSLPCVNELSESFLEYLLDEEDGAVTKWMRIGIAGWRLDVADELPDAFIEKLKKAVRKANPDAVLLGEVWEDASNKVSYDYHRKYIINAALDSVSNYPLRDALIALLTSAQTPAEFGETIMTLQENYPKNVFLSLMNMTGTHDTTRLTTLLGDAPNPETMTTWQQRAFSLSFEHVALAQQRLSLYYVILYTLPGNPCIYYGDEICLEGYKDPYNRCTFDWDSPHTTIPNLIRTLAKLRSKLGTRGGFVRFYSEYSILVYTVSCESCKYTVYVNVTDARQKVALDTKSAVRFALRAEVDDADILLAPYGTVILKD